MKASDSAQLIGLAAIWGASFLFMRTSSAEFGPMALAGLRVGLASLCLLPLLMRQRQLPLLWHHGPALLWVGVTSAALPFVLFNIAALSLPAGLMSIFNATTPIFTALIAWVWLKEGLTRGQVMGLALGLAGVVWLIWSRHAALPGTRQGSALSHPLVATAACVGATLCYGIAANFTRRRLSTLPPLVVATGSQVGAALCLVIPAMLTWPSAAPSGRAWVSAVLMAVLCSGLAYVIFFRLIVRIGTTKTVSVTFLIPLFAMLWGWLFLRETLSLTMLPGGLVILLGTALTTGVLKTNAVRVRS